jgi:hypothetical protein
MRVSLRNGNTSGASNDAHHATLAEADRRAALAEQEAALWRATAEVLRLDRDICREQTERGGAMGGFSGDHYRALRLLSSYPNGCNERLMVWNGVAVETMVDLIRAGLARAETIKRLDRGRPMRVARLNSRRLNGGRCERLPGCVKTHGAIARVEYCKVIAVCES